MKAKVQQYFEDTPKCLKDLVKHINEKFHLNFKDKKENYNAFWQPEKTIKSRNEIYKITLFLPDAPSYEPRKKHSPWLTVILTDLPDVKVKFHNTMSLAVFTDIMTELRRVERVLVKQIGVKEK